MFGQFTFNKYAKAIQGKQNSPMQQLAIHKKKKNLNPFFIHKN